MGRCVNFLWVVVYKFILNRIHTYTYMCVQVYMLCLSSAFELLAKVLLGLTHTLITHLTDLRPRSSQGSVSLLDIPN